MTDKTKNFNIVLKGTGGQGQITLLQILTEAAIVDGYDVKTSELHGLSQKGGSVEAHIRFGQKVYSPMVGKGKADLIVGMEMQEALRALYFASSETQFLLNKKIIPIVGAKNLTEKEILAVMKKVTENVLVVDASNVAQKELEKEVLAGMYLISLAAQRKLIPLSLNAIEKAIKKLIPEKYLEMNLAAFNLARKGV